MSTTSDHDDDDSSVSSSNSSGSRFLPRIFQRADSDPPAVPKYDKENRMLMPSPLPASSPASGRPTGTKRPIPITRWDSDGSEGDPRQREEANVKRLVHMAKQQQSLMTAWFAASSGQDVGVQALSPRRPRSSRSLSSQSLSSLSSGSGPVDVDSMSVSSTSSRNSRSSQSSSGPVDVDSVGGGDSVTSPASSKIKSFLQMIIPSTPSTASSKTVNSATSTQKISNVRRDVEHGDSMDGDSGDNGNKKCIYNRLVVASLIVILVLAIITVVVSVVVGGKNGGGDSSPSGVLGGRPESDGRDNDATAAPSISMAPTTTAPSQFPSMEPSWMPSTYPSLLPSQVPTSAPSASPSQVPTATPSYSPTQSPAPSASPSQSPTSLFATTEFDSLVKMSGSQDSEQYGYTVAVSADGSVVAVGAPNYSFNNTLSRSGRVQVFEHSQGFWQLKGQTLLGRNHLDQFGYAISLSDDGSRLAVSEPGLDGPAGDRSGNVRVFDYNRNSWQLVGSEIGGEAVADLFGLSLVLSGNGKRLAVGSPYHDNENDLNLSGRVRIFEYKDKTWKLLGDALDGPRSLDWFGWAVDLSNDGNIVAIGAPRNTQYGGYVRCFRWTSGKWTQVGSDIINTIGDVQLDDRFGMAVSVSSDGTRVAIGSPWKDGNGGRKSGLVAVYQLGEDDWTLLGDEFVGLKANDRLGWSLRQAGNYLAVGIPGSSQVSFHRWTGFGWDTVNTPLEGDQDNDDFGQSIATSSDGKTVVVGATESSSGAGYARVLERVDP